MATDAVAPQEDDGEEAVVAWERLPAEGTKAYRAFRAYRDLGAERSVSRVAETLGYRSKSHVEGWSSRFDWPARAKAYDVFCDCQQRAEEERNRVAMIRREMMLIQAIRSLVIRRIVGWDGDGDPSLAVEPLDPNDLGARDLAALLREAERMAGHRPEKRDWRREVVRQTQMIAPADYVRTTSTVVEMALTHMSDEGKTRFAQELRAWLSGDWRPPS